MTQAINIKDIFLMKRVLVSQWWCMPVILALGRQRLVYFFQASLVYKVCSGKSRVIERKPITKQTNKQTNKASVLFMVKCLDHGN